MPDNETEKELTTPQHEHRMKLAKKAKEKVPVLKEWYEWVPRAQYDPRKGQKLVRKLSTKNGTTTEFVGWEKKIPEVFFAKLEKEGVKIKSPDYVSKRR